MSDDILIAIPFRLLHAGRRSVAVVEVDTGTVHMLERSKAAILSLCRKARRVSNHAQYICDTYGVTDLTATLEIIMDLRRAGLMLRPSDVLSRVSAYSSQIVGATIDTVGVVTADRPEYLQRCLDSYGRHFSRTKRRVRFLIADDSRDPGSLRRNRLVCQEARQRSDHGITYIGRSQRHEVTGVLANAGVPREGIQIGLQASTQYESIGVSRNLLLLVSAGSALLMVDDDTICSPWVPVTKREGIVLASDEWPTDSMFFRSHSF